MKQTAQQGPTHQVLAERTLVDYGHVLFKRRGAIYASLGVVLTVVALATFTARPIYRATAILQIEKGSPNILTFQDIFSMDQRDELFYQTQYRLIQSRTVARRVIRASAPSPSAEPEGRPGWAGWLASGLRTLLGRPPGPGEALDPETRLVDGFLSRVRVEPYRNSRLVAISFLHTDPEAAAATANAIAGAFIDFNQEARYATTEEAAGFLTRQIDALKQEIETAEKELQDYGTRNEIVSLTGGQDIAARKLSDFHAALTAAQTDRIRKESRYRSLSEAPLDAVEEIVSNPLIRDLTMRFADLERTWTQKSRTYKPEWPELVRLRSEMDRARERLDAESRDLQGKLLQAAESDYREARRQEQSLAEALEAQKTEAARVQGDSIRFASLKMEVDNKRNLLKSLLERQSETGVSARLRGLNSSNVRVVDRAEVPAFPYRPRVKLNLMMGLLAGLILGVGMAMLLDHLDRSIKSLEDLSRYVGLPALATVPPFHRAERGYYRRHEPDGAGLAASPAEAGVQESDDELVVRARPRSAVAEAYRSLRTSLLLSSAEKPPRVLLFTSSQPGEGKTVTTANTALALVQAGKRVLLVDCDLRKPRLHRVMGVANLSGLTTCLTGGASAREAVRPTGIDGLDLLVSGPIPPNPSELLASRAFDRLLAHLAEQGGYDHLILDSPPLLSVTDAQVLASKVDGVILVVRASQAPREAVMMAAESLRQAKANLLGVLFNGADLFEGRLYSYRYRYGYRQGVADAPAATGAVARIGWPARLAGLRSGRIGRQP